MSRYLHYMLMIAVASLVTVGLRWIPFALFSRHRGEFSPRFRAFTKWISPVIISALVVYSYSGLEWRTLWPYLAGLITIVLQLIWKNPLLSIIAGTAFYMMTK